MNLMHDYVPLGLDPYSAHQLILSKCRGAGTILDVGCSAGTLAREMVAAGAVVDGVEVDPDAAREASRFCRQVVVGDFSAGEIDLPKQAYDVVLLADVIEHLADPVAALRRLRPLVGAGGFLLVSTPNIANWSMRLLHLAGRWEYTDRGLMDRTHLRFFTRRTLIRALEEAGYRVVEMDSTTPLPVARREPFNRWAHALGNAWPTMLAYQLIATARPVGNQDQQDPRA
jgi:2-polyprenyl-3-methyl-5-hydroxy-6-metoxy-1,4-benzoquinol methylase